MSRDRDAELDDLQRDLEAAGRDKKPFIHRPEHLDIRHGTLCWLDGSRVCGADCVAFNAEELDPQGEPNDSPQKCLVLTFMGQQGAAALATIAISRKAIADKKRETATGGQPPVPPVGGKKT